MSMNPGFPFLHIILPSFISFIHHQKPLPRWKTEERIKEEQEEQQTHGPLLLTSSFIAGKQVFASYHRKNGNRSATINNQQPSTMHACLHLPFRSRSPGLFANAASSFPLIAFLKVFHVQSRSIKHRLKRRRTKEAHSKGQGKRSRIPDRPPSERGKGGMIRFQVLSVKWFDGRRSGTGGHSSSHSLDFHPTTHPMLGRRC
jgi:hypothetical protein